MYYDQCFLFTKSLYLTQGMSKFSEFIAWNTTTKENLTWTPELLEEREVLGEHLFAKVSEMGLDFNHSEQITGILLDCPKDEVFKMLEDEAFLESRVEKATDALLKSGQTNSSECSRSTEKLPVPQNDTSHPPEVANELFEKVNDIEPDFSSIVTGMLLEMRSDEVQNLLDSQDNLKSAVQKAKNAVVTAKNHDNKEGLGDKLYETVEYIYPDQAAKITGMLMEMKTEMLEELLCVQNEKLLTEKIHQAYTVLLDS